MKLYAEIDNYGLSNDRSKLLLYANRAEIKMIREWLKMASELDGHKSQYIVLRKLLGDETHIILNRYYRSVLVTALMRLNDHIESKELSVYLNYFKGAS